MANLLARETSPYLRQHRDNPVHWWPWGEAAFAEARAANKPILLSVGYAACHWCHVMAHESFEDPATAAVMNELFVNIKLDREERPDVDAIYQQALALMGQQGGWPLTMFLTPEGQPFWGGTYFPPRPAHGRPGFVQVLRQLAGLFADSKDKIEKQVTELSEGLARLNALPDPGTLPPEAFLLTARRLARQVDPFFGGIGDPPKFPQASATLMLWRAWKITGHPVYRDGVLNTVRHLCEGGIYDHLGGGLARYSTDERWLAPHFEKMLYDNAQFLELLGHVWLDTGDALFRIRSEETVGWLLREMRSPAEADGSFGFAAALDADSEGEEGRYYVWDAAEVDALLGADAARFKAAYDVSPAGNWEGRTILNRLHRLDPTGRTDPSGRNNIGDGDDPDDPLLARGRATLLAARDRRIAPMRDDKVLADWNGLAIVGLARAAAAFGRPEWLGTAETVFHYVARHMSRPDGGLFHSRCEDRSQHAAVLDDYAAMSRAGLILFEHTGKLPYLQQAETWTARAAADCGTPEGAFRLSADPDLVARTISPHDLATPSGNGMMLEALARLAHLTGKAAYRETADRLLEAFAGYVSRAGSAMGSFLNAAALLDHGLQVTVTGTPAEQAPFWQAVDSLSLPDLIRIPAESADGLPENHPAAAAAAHAPRPSALVCEGPVCGLPLADPAALARALTSRYRGRPAGWDA